MKHKPVIVYIITKLELGGAQKVCLSLFSQLKSQGFKTILISGAQGYLINEIQHNPDFIPLPELKREISLWNMFGELKTFWFLVKTLRKIRNEHRHVIVHTHSSKAGILGRWAAWWVGIQERVHTIHGYAFHQFQPWYQWWPLYLIELATSLITSKFVCVSSSDIKQGIKLFPYFENRYYLIRAAVQDTFFIPARKTMISDFEEKNKVVFGTVACFKPQKNLFDLLHAFELVQQQIPHAHLEIIGDGHLRSAIETWIAHKGLEQKITLHGWQDQIAPIMQSWNCFVLTSLWEGLPCAIVEARTLKIPVIAYNIGGIHDVINNGNNGFLVEPKRWELVAEKMILLGTNKHLRDQLATAKENLSHFSTAAMVREHAQMYLK